MHRNALISFLLPKGEKCGDAMLSREIIRPKGQKKTGVSSDFLQKGHEKEGRCKMEDVRWKMSDVRCKM